jgi:hypothetical protein
MMETRGYPRGDFEEQAGLVSVSHPELAENYQTARTRLSRSRADQAFRNNRLTRLMESNDSVHVE